MACGLRAPFCRVGSEGFNLAAVYVPRSVRGSQNFLSPMERRQLHIPSEGVTMRFHD